MDKAIKEIRTMEQKGGPKIDEVAFEKLYQYVLTDEKMRGAFLSSKKKLSERRVKKEMSKVFLDSKHYDRDAFRSELIFYIGYQLHDLELEASDFSGKKVLNIGADMPILDKYIRLACPDSEVLSLDIYESSRNSSLNDNYVIGDATQLPIKDESFDIIISHASMPHILVQEEVASEDEVDFLKEDYDLSNIEKELEDLFSESYRVLKPSGQIRFSTIGWNSVSSPGISFSSDENSPITKDKANDYQNKRVLIIKKALRFFEEKHSGVIVFFKELADNPGSAVIIIKKPKVFLSL